MADGPLIRLGGITKSYETAGAPTEVLRGIDLDIAPGAFVALQGPSGSGKSTLLHILGLLDRPTSGRYELLGRDVSTLDDDTLSELRNKTFGFVFQSFHLIPYITAQENVLLPGLYGPASRRELIARARDILGQVGLADRAEFHPGQLSGGQQQRVALARAMAPRPQVLLLDEPLSALDAKVRVSLREEIRAIQKELGITTVFVTHDQEEALSMSDRIVVMYNGRAEQVGTPFEIYNRPATRFVAGFVGTLNVIEGRIVDADSGRISIAGGEISVGNRVSGRPAGEAVSLALRPEAIALGRREGRDGLVSGTIREVSFLGSVIRVRVEVGDALLSLDTFNSPASPPPVDGERAEISFSSSDMLILDR